MLQAKEDYVVESAPLCLPCADPFLRIEWKISSNAREQARHECSQEKGDPGQNLHYKRRVQGCVDLAI